MELELSRLSNIAKRRIQDFYLKGVASPGVGMDLIRLLQPANSPLSYLYIGSHSRSIPSKGRKLAPYCITMRNVANDEQLLKHLKDYNVTDIARWKMMSDGEPVPNIIAGGVHDRYGLNNSYMLYLSGLQSKADIKKHFAPLIVHGERLERGKEGYERFLKLRTIELVTP